MEDGRNLWDWIVWGSIGTGYLTFCSYLVYEKISQRKNRETDDKHSLTSFDNTGKKYQI